MNDFLGSKTQEQIKMIKAILILRESGIKIFSAKDVSEKCGIPSQDFGGAFKSIANQAGNFPALILKSGRERIEMADDERRYIQFDWESLKEALKHF
jgi:hypothetical protein